MVPEETNSAKIAVIILTVNQRENTIQCLSSLKSVKSPPHNILLWDNGSTDGTAETVREAFPEVLVHSHPMNIGAAAGRNGAAELAIKTFAPSHLLFIDNDTVVSSTFLEALLRPFEGNNRVAQTTPKIRSLKDNLRLEEAGGTRIRFWLGSTIGVGYGEIDCGQHDKAEKCIAGGCMLVRTDVFKKIRGFDPKFDPYGYEDLDFSLRLYEADYYCLYVPQSLIFHDRSQTFESGQYTEKYACYKARNWLFFMRRHAPLRGQIGFLFLGAPLLFIRMLIRESRKGNLAAVRGLVTGIFDFKKSSRHASKERQ